MHQVLQKLAKTLSAFRRKHELVQHPNRERIGDSGHGLDIALAIPVGIFSLPMVITTCPRASGRGNRKRY